MEICDCFENVSVKDDTDREYMCYTICNGTREREECTCGGNPIKCDFYPSVRAKALEKYKECQPLRCKTDSDPLKIYYAHHQWKYGTKIEEYELNLIRNYYPDALIFNPATDLKETDSLDEDTIMNECLDKVRESDIVIFSAMDGMIGVGVYNEIMAAKEASKLVFCLVSNKLYSIFSICESPECGSDRLYARISAPIHFGVSKYNKI